MPSETAQRILDKLTQELAEESILPALLQEKATRATYGKCVVQMPTKDGTLDQRSLPINRAGVDIYGLEKPTDIRYFKCTNCARSVAGGRLAAHIAKCVSRGHRQRATYV